MNDESEHPLLALALFPFRLLGILAQLVTLLWLIMLCGGALAFIGAFLWLVITGP